jgi:cysteine-rich repeat protein
MTFLRVLPIRLLTATLSLAVTACFAPSYPTEIPCSENGSCPPGQTCDVDGICRHEPLPPGGPDAMRAPDAGTGTPDAGADARASAPDAQLPPDAAPRCFNDDQCPGDQVCRADGACVAPTCDDGARNGDESAVDCGGQTCPPCADGATCNTGNDCASGVCASDRTCAAPSCGDGVPNGGELCDVAGESLTCDLDCTAVVCGDRTRNATAGEACDTGGNSLTCDQDCTEPACGDGVRNPFVETCDEGAVDTATCDRDCTIPQCGDGLFNALAEFCETGTNTATCDQDCTPPACGDVFINPQAGEECDAGGNNAICDDDCTFSACGDSFFNPVAGEQCDAGGNAATCDADCTLPACGDGFVNPAAGEECDDGNSVNGDGCTATCASESPNQCTAGTDPVTGSRWVVCDADAQTAWISHAVAGGGVFHSDLICQSLGYSRVLRFGGNFGSVCGFNEAGTSCSNLGSRVFEGSNGCAFPTLCNTVTWECGR